MSTDTPAGRVLVVDGDYDTLGALSRALRARGHHVVLAADGRGGLQRAVEIAPDVVLVDREVPIVDVRTFLEVLRDNPRTSGAHTFLMGVGDPARLVAIDAKAEPLVKPFHAEEVAARIEEVLRARRGPRKDAELRGDIAQVALFDLLQVFAVNRRTGRLQVEASGGMGEVWLRDGRIVDANARGAVGEKALYRILAETRGRFVFLPNLTPLRERIDAPTDQLLMEAVRQADEIARLRDVLPPLAALVSLSITPTATSAVATELVARLDEPRAIEELLDLLGHTDLDILGAVRELLEGGALLVFDPRGERVRLCAPEEAVSLRAAALRLRRSGLEGPVRLGVLTGSSADLARFARALSAVEEFVASSQLPAAAGDGAIGSLGVLRLAGADLEVYALPLDASLRPLWGPLLAPARVALFLSDERPPDDVIDVLRTLGVDLVPAPAGWELPSGAAAAVRAALGAVAPLTPVPAHAES